jgi:hypothetical protein
MTSLKRLLKEDPLAIFVLSLQWLLKATSAVVYVRILNRTALSFHLIDLTKLRVLAKLFSLARFIVKFGSSEKSSFRIVEAVYTAYGGYFVKYRHRSGGLLVRVVLLWRIA